MDNRIHCIKPNCHHNLFRVFRDGRIVCSNCSTAIPGKYVAEDDMK